MIQTHTAPYPLVVLKGRLRLSGVRNFEVEKIIERVFNNYSAQSVIDETKLIASIRDELSALNSDALTAFEILTQYEELRRSASDIPPIILIIEGASATGKSMIALEMIYNLGVTRILSTDTIRQILRSVKEQQKYPELFCHTYQAYVHKQVGSEKLNPIVRGFLAQLEHIDPLVKQGVRKFLNEGADAIIEGVHIIPGTLAEMGRGIIEILINPDMKTHEEMFVSKFRAGKLRTVSDDERTRTAEFQAAKLIQKYMMNQADINKIDIILFNDYEDAVDSISRIVVAKVEELMKM